MTLAKLKTNHRADMVAFAIAQLTELEAALRQPDSEALDEETTSEATVTFDNDAITVTPNEE